MDAKPCPKACQFDWESFEILLNCAIAHLVEEKLICDHEITVADFFEYVRAKQEAAERREREEVTYGEEEEEEEETPAAPGFPGGHRFGYLVKRVPRTR